MHLCQVSVTIELSVAKDQHLRNLPISVQVAQTMVSASTMNRDNSEQISESSMKSSSIK
jgi:hypothetical protein